MAFTTKCVDSAMFEGGNQNTILWGKAFKYCCALYCNAPSKIQTFLFIKITILTSENRTGSLLLWSGNFLPLNRLLDLISIHFSLFINHKYYHLEKGDRVTRFLPKWKGVFLFPTIQNILYDNLYLIEVDMM